MYLNTERPGIENLIKYSKTDTLDVFKSREQAEAALEGGGKTDTLDVFKSYRYYPQRLQH